MTDTENVRTDVRRPVKVSRTLPAYNGLNCGG